MGGHDHGHHHAPYTVPKPETYRASEVDKIYELSLLKKELAKKGLKDPWIRFVLHCLLHLVFKFLSGLLNAPYEEHLRTHRVASQRV